MVKLQLLGYSQLKTVGSKPSTPFNRFYVDLADTSDFLGEKDLL